MKNSDSDDDGDVLLPQSVSSQKRKRPASSSGHSLEEDVEASPKRQCPPPDHAHAADSPDLFATQEDSRSTMSIPDAADLHLQEEEMDVDPVEEEKDVDKIAAAAVAKTVSTSTEPGGTDYSSPASDPPSPTAAAADYEGDVDDGDSPSTEEQSASGAASADAINRIVATVRAVAGSQSHRGVSLYDLNSSTQPARPRPSGHHTVFVQWPPGSPDGTWQMAQHTRKWTCWDSHHVKMPFDKQSQFPVLDCITGRKELRFRWELTEEALTDNISTFQQFEAAIGRYNISASWKLEGLQDYFENFLEDTERDSFFSINGLLSQMIHLCLSIPRLIGIPCPLLRQKMNHSITMSQNQIASLLANAFFCTYPRRNATYRSAEFGTYPSINFNTLFFTFRRESQPHKLSCLFHYFRRVVAKSPNEHTLVTYRRRHVPKSRMPNWAKSTEKLRALHVDDQGTIEDNGKGMLQVDFANKFLGGGVLGAGCVQEEILFLMSPELILSRLFTEELDDDECLVVTGHERFSNYTGYSDTFRFAGDHKDETPVDGETRHRRTQVVAIDAQRYLPDRRPRQYAECNVLRDLNKAYVGFYTEDDADNVDLSGRPPAVATGNWGCGAFGGDPELKSLQQLMAAAQTGRDMAYFTFGDQDLRNRLHKMHQALVKREVTVGQLFSMLKDHYGDGESFPYNLFRQIYRQLMEGDLSADRQEWAEEMRLAAEQEEALYRGKREALAAERARRRVQEREDKAVAKKKPEKKDKMSSILEAVDKTKHDSKPKNDTEEIEVDDEEGAAKGKGEATGDQDPQSPPLHSKSGDSALLRALDMTDENQGKAEAAAPEASSSSKSETTESEQQPPGAEAVAPEGSGSSPSKPKTTESEQQQTPETKAAAPEGSGSSSPNKPKTTESEQQQQTPGAEAAAPEGSGSSSPSKLEITESEQQQTPETKAAAPEGSGSSSPSKPKTTESEQQQTPTPGAEAAAPEASGSSSPSKPKATESEQQQPPTPGAEAAAPEANGTSSSRTETTEFEQKPSGAEAAAPVASGSSTSKPTKPKTKGSKKSSKNDRDSDKGQKKMTEFLEPV